MSEAEIIRQLRERNRQLQECCGQLQRECTRTRKAEAEAVQGSLKQAQEIRELKADREASRKFTDRLQLRVKALERENEALKAGKGCQACKEKHARQMATAQKKLDKARRDLESEKTRASNALARNRRMYDEVYDDVAKSAERAIRQTEKECAAVAAAAEKRACKAEAKAADLKEKNQEVKKENYELKTALEERDERIEKQKRLLNRNSRNSSLASSQERTANKPKRSTRKSSGRSQGAQRGHKPHPRPDYEATESWILKPPQEILDNPEWTLTGRTKSKKIVDLEIRMRVVELVTEEYRNERSGETFIVKFPKEFSHNEMSYGPGVQGLILMLTHVCNVASRKTQEFLYEATDGMLFLSNGYIAGTARKFAERAQPEMEEIFRELAESSVIYADTTVIPVNAEQHAATVNANRNAVLFHYSRHKGYEAVDGTPLADNDNTVVSDCEVAFLRQGSDHQICLQHILRDAQDSIENDHDKKWSKRLYVFIKRLFRENDSFGDEMPSEEYKRQVRAEFDEILEQGRQEYEYDPPTWYTKGRALRNRLEKYKDYVFTYLDNREIEMTNNRSERALRHMKRKAAQAVTFRSGDSVDDFCTVSSIVKTERANGRRVFPKLRDVLARPKPADTRSV